MTKLQSSRAGEDVVYTYQDSVSLQYPSEITHYRVWHTNVCTGAPVSPGPQTPGEITNTAFVKSRNPKEIFFPGGKIVFVEEGSTRMDGLGKACDKIEIYGYDFSGSGGYTKIRTYDLDFIYKTRSGSSEKVLFLDKVRLLGATGSEEGRYTLEYNSEALPARTSLQKDHWGYKNAASSNTSLIPNQTVNYQPTCNPGNSSTTLTGGNREVDTLKMQAWILTKINYPTGGHTSFTFQAHRFLDGSTPVLVGGLRIKSQVSNDANGKTITRRYKYGVGENGYGTDRDLSNKTLITDQKIKTINAPSPPTDWSYNIHTLSAGVNTILNPFESVPVTYAQVTEYEDINGAGTNGRTVYTFRDNADDELINTGTTMRQALQSEHWNRGQLLSKVVYGSDARMKSKEVNAYRPIVSLTESETLGYVFGRSEVRMNPGPPNGQGCLVDDDQYQPIRKYNWKTGLVKLDTIKSWQFDDGDDSRSVFQKTELTYDPNWYQLKEIRKYNTDGHARIQRFRYCTDLSNLAPTLTGQAKAFYQLKANNQLHTPVEVLRLHQKGSSSAIVLGGTLTLFRTHLFNSHQYVLPDEVYQAKIDGFFGLPESSFNPVNVNGSGVITKFDKYQLRIEYDSYTSTGRLSSFHRTAGSTTSYTHQSTFNQVYHHRLLTETGNTGSSNAQTTNYITDMPIVGVNQITAPNALKTYFEYDDYGRLQRIKDDNQDILKEHAYQYSTSGNNFIQDFVPRTAQGSLTGDHTSFETITHFYDGLGRPLQDLHFKGSPDGVNNLITNAVTYDHYDRREYQYVPFHASGAATSKATLPGVVHGDSKPYTRFKEFDDSPLNRTTKIVGPGNTWHTLNKQTEIQYLVAPGGRVRKYQSGLVGATVEGSYGANELVMQKTISEQGNEVIEFYDNDGKLIQKDEQDGSGGNYRKTAYIYDEWDRLKYVIQPESFLDSVDFTNNDSYFQKGVFSYIYDSLGRMVNLHVPGSGWTYHVHDRLDQIVLTQTELQRPGSKWSFNRHDAFGRVAENGEVEIPSQTPVQLRNAFNTHATAFEHFNSGTGLYNLASFPTFSGASFDLRTRNIFDYYGAYVTGYAFDNSHAYETNYSNARGLLTYVLEWDSRDKNQYYTVLHYDDKGRIIQTKKSHHLGGSSPGNKPVITSFKLNFPGQTLAQKSTYQFDQLSSVTQVDSFKYDHKGRVLEYSNGTNQAASQICTTSYDQTGRLITKVYLPGGSFTTGGMQDYIYRPPSPNALNTEDTARRGIILDAGTEIDVSLINSYLAVIDTTLTDPDQITNLQTINYSYNIRDWLTGINLDGSGNPNPNGGQGDLFSLKLFYDLKNRYDGTLGKQTWTISADAQNPQRQRSYTYSYDESNRLKKADYSGVNGENFTVDSLRYDKNGNIQKLWRYGMKGSSYGFVDKLDYTYNGNRLTQVEDAESGDHQVDFYNRASQANEYEYYNDGSLKKDLNENISQIDYDTHLKLPVQVTLTTGDWIKYTYDGQGGLIRRELSSGIIWDYIDGMILKDNLPYQIAMPEGRVIYEEGTWRNEYEYRDNVGNLRLAFTERNGSLQKTLVSDYSPFGIPINQKVFTPTPCKFTFHGHEDQGDFSLRMMNMGARCYNQTIGRFLGNDAFSSTAPSWTGYRLGWNQPQNVNDPTGNYEYTDGYGTWDIASVASSTVVYGNLERAPGQSGDPSKSDNNNVGVTPTDEGRIIRDEDGNPIKKVFGDPGKPRNRASHIGVSGSIGFGFAIGFEVGIYADGKFVTPYVIEKYGSGIGASLGIEFGQAQARQDNIMILEALAGLGGENSAGLGPFGFNYATDRNDVGYGGTSNSKLFIDRAFSFSYGFPVSMMGYSTTTHIGKPVKSDNYSFA